MRHRKRGFIIFFGWRSVKGGDGSAAVEGVCPLCRQTAKLRGRVMRKWFTLFFIPVVPMQSVAAGYRFAQCSACRGEINRTVDQLARSAQGQGAADYQSAIALYNQMRERPDDAATLLELVRMYLAMNEARDAETACRMFPAAYAKDPAIEQAMRAVR